MRKILLLLFVLTLLSSCAQSTALLGPAISIGSTGNVMQAGFSYGTNMAVKQTTGKMPSEHFSLYIKGKKEEKKLKKRKEKIRKEIANYLQSHIEIMRDKLNSKNRF